MALPLQLEACSADLDYSKFKNRRATFHHHSTLNLRKRSRPISGCLSAKSPEEQSVILAKARKLAPDIRNASRQKQLIVLEELNSAMVDQQTAKAAKEHKHQQAKHKLVRDIEGIGGACKSSKDVDNLLENCETKTEKMAALKLHCRFYREFFNAKLPLSNLQPEQLALNLCDFFAVHSAS